MFDAPNIPKIDLNKLLPEISSTISDFDPNGFSAAWHQQLGPHLAPPRGASRILTKQVGKLDEASCMAVIFDFLVRHHAEDISCIIPAVLETPGAQDGYNALTRSLTASSPELEDELADMEQPVAAIVLRILFCAIFELDPKSTLDAFLADGAARAFSHRFDQKPEDVLQTLAEAYARRTEDEMPDDCQAYVYVLSGIRSPRELFLPEVDEEERKAAVAMVKKHLRSQHRHARSCPNCEPIEEAEAVDDCIAMTIRDLLNEVDEDDVDHLLARLGAMIDIYCDSRAYIATLVSNEGQGAAMATLRFEALDCTEFAKVRRTARRHPVAIRHAALAKAFAEIVEGFEERMSHPEKLWED